MAEWFPIPIELQGPHEGHEEHLCVAHAVRYLQTNLEGYKKLVRNPKYICKECGRAAAKAENLCEPEAL
jgi:hypothetical protein